MDESELREQIRQELKEELASQFKQEMDDLVVRLDTIMSEAIKREFNELRADIEAAKLERIQHLIPGPAGPTRTARELGLTPERLANVGKKPFQKSTPEDYARAQAWLLEHRRDESN